MKVVRKFAIFWEGYNFENFLIFWKDSIEILIFEKIKESLSHGASVGLAVKEGFSDAMVVILDSNITTFIVAVVLFKFGTGPIKGFAVTMMIGITSTLITGLFFLRSIFNFILNLRGKEIQKLSI